ncbi:MAG: glycosyltransferase family 4 protein [Eubacteriales bacterium]|nr:glycosyltransferase family 4 protein [Eubacteriales bacterium]
MDEKRIWIINQHAQTPKLGNSIRHYAISKYLVRDGYEPIVFSSNQLHSATGNAIEVGEDGYAEEYLDGVRFVYVKTHKYTKNDIHRILNIFSFYFSVLKTAKKIEKKYGKPDIVYSSTMSPTALVAGNRLAKKYKVKSINETRDIIPEGFAGKGIMKETGIVAKILRTFMKSTYKKADALIFTMSGGQKYIEDMGWYKRQGGFIADDRVYYVNNGVDCELSECNAKTFVHPDEHLDDPDLFIVSYIGSVRFLNNIPLFVSAAEYLKKSGCDKIKILVWGAGTKTGEINQMIADKGLDNIILKGRVEKKYVPSIANRSDLFILTANFSSVQKYGASPNKLFDYFEAGRPVIVPTVLSDSLVAGNGAGSEIDSPDGKRLAEEIIRYFEMDKTEYEGYCENSKRLAAQFDYAVHAKSMERIFDDVLSDRRKNG